MDYLQTKREYENNFYPLYDKFTTELYSLIERCIKETRIPIVSIEGRTKTPDSFLRKIEQKGYTYPLYQNKDFTGIRIVTFYQDDASKVSDMIYEEFTIDSDHSMDKLYQLDVDEFGYRCIHLVVALKEPRKSLAEWKKYADLWAEIQIRSILQHAWASLSRRIYYKRASQAPPELARKLFRLSALLELADEEFISIRDQEMEMIKKSIRSTLSGVNVESAVFSISEKEAITTNEKLHYVVNGSHFYRFFSIMKVLTGDEHVDFFYDTCKILGELLNKIEFKYILYLNKESNYLFSSEVSKICKKIILPLGYKEDEDSPPIYREDEDLKGENVVVLSALELTHKPLKKVVDFIKNEKATLKKIYILFSALSDKIELEKILGTEISTVFDIDLQLTPEENCERCKQKQEFKPLTFNDY